MSSRRSILISLKVAKRECYFPSCIPLCRPHFNSGLVSRSRLTPGYLVVQEGGSYMIEIPPLAQFAAEVLVDTQPKMAIIKAVTRPTPVRGGCGCVNLF